MMRMMTMMGFLMFMMKMTMETASLTLWMTTTGMKTCDVIHWTVFFN